MEAKKCKCCECGKQAVAFYPVVDPDIPAHPYCADCLYKAMVSLAEAMWGDDWGNNRAMLAMAKYKAEKVREKYKNKEL